MSDSDKVPAVTGIVGSGSATFGTPSMSATLSTRSNFAIHHLRAAKRAAQSANEIEQKNATSEHGPWFDDMLMLVPVAVVMSGAALEANANEIIQDILDGSTSLPVTESRRQLLLDLKKDRSGNSTDKYRQLALLFEKIPTKGATCWQDAVLLAKFRNELIHFKPAWDHEPIHDGDVVKALKSKIPPYRAYIVGFQFPFGYMTYGCARWSIQAVLAFSQEFSLLLGVSDRFAAGYLDFTLP